MREIITIESPKMSLKSIPPHKLIRNIFSDLLIENLTRDKPIKKLIIEMNEPKIIDLKITFETTRLK